MSADTAAPPSTTPITALGTPASPKWDPEWLAQVDQLEQSLGHRICGAHTPAWTPCKLTSTHPNGRCRFHGGAPGIGAPNGNRNAIIHGLYSRRLQQCGDHCPLWNHCPMAGQDVLSLDPRERPHCAYEKAEYHALLISLTAESTTNSRSPDPSESSNPSKSSDQSTPSSQSHASHASHPSYLSTLCASAPPREPNLIERNIALFQVMLSRAQAALGIARLTDENNAASRHYEMRSTKIAPLVQAQLHIARELRAWLRLLYPPRAKAPDPAGNPPNSPKYTGAPMRAMELLKDKRIVAGIREGLGLKPGERNPFVPDLPEDPDFVADRI